MQLEMFSLRKLNFVQRNDYLFEIWSLLIIVLPASSNQYW